MKSRITLALAAIALLGAVGYATTIAVVKADENGSHPFVEVLAERFGLNEDEVEEALDEIKADHFAQMQERKEDGLNQAVEDGVLTEEQKNALLEKHQDMWEERQEEHEQYHKEMEDWFTEQGIDHNALMGYMGGYDNHSRMMKHGFGYKNFQ